MPRSKKKGPFVDKNILKKIQKNQDSNKRIVIKTWARASMISPEMIGTNICVHDGRKHVSIIITEDMVGHKLGEFAPSRTFRGHSGARK